MLGETSEGRTSSGSAPNNARESFIDPHTGFRDPESVYASLNGSRTSSANQDHESRSQSVEYEVGDDGTVAASSYTNLDVWIEGDKSFGKFQALLVAQAGLGWFAVSFLWLSMTFTAPLIKDDLNISKYKSGLAGSALFAGAAAGTYLISSFADYVGRKRALLWSTWMAAASGVGTALVRNYAELVVLRLLNGFLSAGMCTIGYCLVVEYTPVTWRARAGISLNVAWSIAAAVVST